MPTHGSYPFGASLRAVVQTDRTRKPVFVLGVYASAVHARWVDATGRTLIKALAVASEPSIFWDGSGAERLVADLEIPEGAGRLEACGPKFNGPSGRSLDEDFLAPLGIGRCDAWLCDLVPHTCLNPSQARALAREYEPRAEALGLPPVDLPPVPKVFADEIRRRAIVDEIEEAAPEVIVFLGDQPIRHFLRAFDDRWSRLVDFGVTAETYGRLHPVKINGKPYAVLPVAHPRQVSGLVSHSRRWRNLHASRKMATASTLLTSGG